MNDKRRITDSKTFPDGFTYEVSNTERGFTHRLCHKNTKGDWRTYSRFASIAFDGAVYVVGTDYFAESDEFPFAAGALVKLTEVR